MPFLPQTTVTVQNRCPSGSFFRFTHIVAQRIETKHKYIMCPYHPVHIHIRTLVLFSSGQFIYLHGHISFLLFLSVGYK